MQESEMLKQKLKVAIEMNEVNEDRKRLESARAKDKEKINELENLIAGISSEHLAVKRDKIKLVKRIKPWRKSLH